MDGSEKNMVGKFSIREILKAFLEGRESIGISGILPDDPGGITCMGSGELKMKALEFPL